MKKFLILFFSLVSCSEANQKEGSDDVFFQYMKNNLKEPIQDNVIYVVIPNLGCGSCITSSLMYISEKSKCNKNTVLIVSRSLDRIPKFNREKISKNVTRIIADTIYDGVNTLDRVQLPFKSFTGIIARTNGNSKYISFDNTNYKAVLDKYLCY